MPGIAALHLASPGDVGILPAAVARERDPPAHGVRLPAAQHPGDAGILPAAVARKRNPLEVRLPAAQRIVSCRSAGGPPAYFKAVDGAVETPICSDSSANASGKKSRVERVESCRGLRRVS